MIKFYKNRYKFFAISLVLIVLGFVFLGINGMDLSIQFKGGAILKYTYQNEIDTEQVAAVVSQTLNRSADVQLTTDLATDTQKVVISLAGTEGVSAQDQETLDNALKAAFPDNGLNLSESNIVQAFIGKKFLQNSMIALILSSVLIVIYVAIRFQKISGLSAGVMALVALFHDVAMHHPFTSWMEEDEELLETAPDQVRAKAYDLVLNGIEMGSGSIRIHRSDMQSRMFDMIGLSPEEAKHRFGFLLEAFKYGTPPHGGFAFGVDRLVMILTGSENLREVVAFPKAQNANCLMMQTPSDVQEEQLKMLHIRVANDEQE